MEIYQCFPQDPKTLRGNVFNDWIRENEKIERNAKFIALENETAQVQPKESGLFEMQTAIKLAADSVVNNRKEIPIRWIVLIEQPEKLGRFIIASDDLLCFTTNFLGFSRTGLKEELQNAMDFFGGQGRIQKYDLDSNRYVIFTDPSKLTDAFKELIDPPSFKIKNMSQSNQDSHPRGYITIE